MAAKVLSQSSISIENGIKSVATGEWLSGPVRVFVTSESIADANRHRPWPVPCLTPTNFYVTDRVDNPGPVSRVRNGRLYVGTPSFVFGGSSSKISQSGDGDMAVSRARAKFSENNFGESLVEFTETVGLLNKTMGTLFRGFSYAKNGQWSKLGRLWDNPGAVSRMSKLPPSKRLAKGYLEFQFGWAPLLSDVYSAVEAYSNGLATTGDRIRKKSGQLTTKRNLDRPLEATATASGIVRNQGAARLNQLGLSNPALMAWNKLPFSFLIDWFVPVSTYLGGITASAGLGCFSLCTTTQQLTTFTTTGWDSSVIYRQTLRATRLPVFSSFGGLSPRDSALGMGQSITLIALLRSLS